MIVKELLARLAHVDPEAEVLFLGSYADVSEADEVQHVDIRSETWTHEKGMCAGEQYEARYPGNPAERESDYTNVVTCRVRVVVLSAGPTNLRYASF
ncbi:hypothetical protein VSR82_32800 [Burkholderia sp. JPY481]